MRKRTAALLIGVSAAILLAGCGQKLDVDRNTVALRKNGKVLEAAVEDFSQSYYSEEELESYIDETVGAYDEENGKKSVSVTDSRVEEQKAYLTLSFKDVATYSDFTGVECFAGSIMEAESAGYDFSGDFYAVKDGAAQKKTVSGDQVKADDDLHVFIVKENSDIIVPGDIAYVSAEGTSVSAKDTVAVEPKENDTDENILVYVLYK